MAVFVTKSIISNLSKMQYATLATNQYQDESTSSNDHWQKLFMANLKSTTLSKEMICRVCARDGCTPLTEKVCGYEILTALTSISNVCITPEDSLPKYICNNCLETLKIVMTFKRECESSDRKFKKILFPMGDPSLHSYPYSKHDFKLILQQMKAKRDKIDEKKEKDRKQKEKIVEKNIGPRKQFKCSSCDMTFTNRDELRDHRRERQCMRRACDVCGQLVLCIGQHMRQIHNRSLSHKCPTCGKEFPIMARLRNHMLTHTNTFNFFCDLCPYRCKHKYYLVMHMRTHTGEKPYKCTECPATFVNPSNLNKHKLTHQEKQFKCSLCEKAFRTKSSLREHQEATHMKIRHICDFCGREFCYRCDLRKHQIRSHHRVKRDYVGGEPTYKQVERLQKLETVELETDAIDKWHVQQTQIVAPPTVQATYIEHAPGMTPMYLTDMALLVPQHQVEQTTVQISLPELDMKKDDDKLYEPQGIGYF